MSIRAAIKELSRSVGYALIGKAGSVGNPNAFLSSPFNAMAKKENLVDPYKQLGLVYMVVNANTIEASSVDFKIMTGGPQSSFSDEPGSKNMSRRERKVFHLIERARDAQDPRLTRKAQRKAAGELRELETGPAYELFRRPAKNISTTELFGLTYTHLLVLGEALWIKLGPNGKPTNQFPSELLPVKPSMLKKVMSDDGTKIARWDYITRGGSRQSFDADQVIFFRFPDPDNPAIGQSPLLAGQVDYETDFQAAMFNLAFFLNSANPGGILRMKDDGDTPGIEERDRLENQLNDRHSGYGKRGRWMVVDGNAEVDLNTVTQRDMEFLGVRKFTLEMLLGTFRTPKTVIGLDNDVPRDVARTQIRRWWTSTIFSLHHLVEDALAIQLFIPLTREAEVGIFDHSNVEALQENLTEKLDQAFKMQGMGITLRVANKKLEIFDEDDLGEVADQVFIGGALTPLEGLLSQDDPDEEVNGQVQPPKPDDDDQPDEEEDQPEGSDKRSLVQALTKRLATSEQRDLYWRTKERTVLRPAETQFRSKLKNVLYRMRVETIKRLHATSEPGKSKSFTKDILGPGQVEQVLIDREKWAQDMFDTLEPAYISAMKKGSASTARDLQHSFTFSEQDPAVITMLDARKLQLSNVTQNMIDSVRRTLISSAQAQDTTAQTADKVRSLFNDMTKGRAIRIARTESAIAVEGSREIVFEDAGVDKLMWVTARDSFVRDSHAIDGQVRHRGEAFTNGLRWPLDLEANAGPEEYVNCRCIPAPVD